MDDRDQWIEDKAYVELNEDNKEDYDEKLPTK